MGAPLARKRNQEGRQSSRHRFYPGGSTAIARLVFLVKQSHSVAVQLLDSLERTLQLLAESPDREFLQGDESHHEREIRVQAVVGFSNILVFFRTAELAVEIIRVLQGARDLETLSGE